MTKLEYFGALVRQAREEMRITELELADEVELDVRTIRKLEAGQCNLSFEKFFPIIPFLHISPNIFFHASPDQTGLEMDRIYRALLRLSAEQLAMLLDEALFFKRWTEKHGEYSTVDEYYAILDKIDKEKADEEKTQNL